MRWNKVNGNSASKDYQQIEYNIMWGDSQASKRLSIVATA